MTDLLDAERSLANALLALSLARWGIERGFQQRTAVFHPQALIGTPPPGTGFQLAFCFQLYNLLQGVRAYVATAQARPPETISTAFLFAEVQRPVVALTELVPPTAIELLCELLPSQDSLGEGLSRLLGTGWSPRWLKAPAQKPKPPPARTAIRGNQTSVYRLLAAYRQQQQAVTSPAP